PRACEHDEAARKSAKQTAARNRCWIFTLTSVAAKLFQDNLRFENRNNEIRSLLAAGAPSHEIHAGAFEVNDSQMPEISSVNLRKLRNDAVVPDAEGSMVQAQSPQFIRDDPAHNHDG